MKITISGHLDETGLFEKHLHSVCEDKFYLIKKFFEGWTSMWTEVIKINLSTWISNRLLARPIAKDNLGNWAVMEQAEQCCYG